MRPFFLLMIPLRYVRDHLAILDGFEDYQLKLLRDQACDLVELDIGRVIQKRELRKKLNGFPVVFDDLRTPLIAVNEIIYINSSNASQIVDPALYAVTGEVFDKYGAHRGGTDYYFYPEVRLHPGNCWPDDVSTNLGSVEIRYTAGFEPHELPDGLMRGILIAMATLHENRESLSPVQMYSVPAYEFAVAPYRKLRR